MSLIDRALRRQGHEPAITQVGRPQGVRKPSSLRWSGWECHLRDHEKLGSHFAKSSNLNQTGTAILVNDFNERAGR
jgi:hypothetical protein